MKPRIRRVVVYVDDYGNVIDLNKAMRRGLRTFRVWECNRSSLGEKAGYSVAPIGAYEHWLRRNKLEAQAPR